MPVGDAALTRLDVFARRPEALDGLSAAVTATLRPAIGAGACCIMLWDRERDILRALPGAFGAVDRDQPASITGPASNPRSNAARVFATGRPFMSNRAQGDPGLLQSYVDYFNITRVLSVPLDLDTHRLGVLVLINKPGDFTEADLACAQRLAPRIAMSVDLALTMRRMRVQQRLETILATTAVAIASGQSIRDCLLPAFVEFADVTGASLAGLIPADGEPLVWRTASPGAAIEARFLQDAAALTLRSAGRYPQAAGDPGWAALHAPVELHGERIAALSVLRQNGEPFARYEADVVTRLANIAALAWAGERYQHQLAELARSRERERIADELHDRVAQILFAAQIGLDSMLEDAAADAERVLEVRALLAKGETAVRDVIDRLAIAPEPDLTRRLHLEIEAVEEEFGVAIHAELDDPAVLHDVPRPVADCLVRVAREATVNAAKHAGPCRITLAVAAGRDDIVLTVDDDGVGLRGGAAGRRDGHGLPSLRRAVHEAGGELRISEPGDALDGLRVSARFARS